MQKRSLIFTVFGLSLLTGMTLSSAGAQGASPYCASGKPVRFAEVS